jgi:hypothetical protein
MGLKWCYNHGLRHLSTKVDKKILQAKGEKTMTKRKRITALIMSFAMAFMLTFGTVGATPLNAGEPEAPPPIVITPFNFNGPGKFPCG